MRDIAIIILIFMVCIAFWHNGYQRGCEAENRYMTHNIKSELKTIAEYEHKQEFVYWNDMRVYPRADKSVIIKGMFE